MKTQSTEVDGWKIDSHIPIPRRGPGAYPFKHLKIGQSFYVNDKKKAASVMAGASLFAKKNKGFKFTSQANAKVIRVWRIAANGK